MQSFIQRTPIRKRADAIEQIDKDLAAGKLDILAIYRQTLRDREHQAVNNSIPQGLGLGGATGLGLIVLGTAFPLVLISAGSVVVGRYWFARDHWNSFRKDEMQGDIAPYLSDSELLELEDLLANAGYPATKELAKSYTTLIDSMDEVIELEDSPELVKLREQLRDWSTEKVKQIQGADAPSDTAADVLPQAVQHEESATNGPLQTLDLAELIYPPLVLLWGSQGSGKTTAANWIIYKAASDGWLVCVADPHYAAGDWPGLPVYGKAANYQECDDVLAAAMSESAKRYQERAEKGTKPYEFQQILIVLEEFTNWSSECELSSDFIKKATKDFRKVGIHILVVSHGQTLTATGGAKGLRETFDKGSVKVELFSQMTTVTLGGKEQKRPRPTGICSYTVMGAEQGQFKVPDLSNWKVPTSVVAKPFFISGDPAESQQNLIDDTNQGTEIVRPTAAEKTISGTSLTQKEALTKIAAWVMESPERRMPQGKLLIKFSEPDRDAIKPVLGKLMQKVEIKLPSHFTTEKAKRGDSLVLLYTKSSSKLEEKLLGKPLPPASKP